MRQVFAYLDPGTGSMVLQVVVGGIAAVGVAGRYYWRKVTGRGATAPQDGEVPAESANAAVDEAPTSAD